MRLAGWDKDIMADANVDTFLEQAVAYKDMINGNAWNKTLEYMIMSQISHPLTAVRALECGEWAKSELFSRILNGRPVTAEDKTVWAQPENNDSGVEKNPEPFDFFGFLRPKKQEDAGTAQTAEPEPAEETEAEKELRWYKKMVEAGLITQEQYEQKKRELLGE